MGDVDRRNTKRMKEIVDKHGWLTPWMVGRDGARAAWLLVQHADHDLAFQREMLAMMECHNIDEQVHPADLAYLTDRVRVNEGKPQVYGTQFHVVDGKLTSRPIEDEENVDKRRKSAGLSPLKEYINT